MLFHTMLLVSELDDRTTNGLVAYCWRLKWSGACWRIESIRKK